MKRRSQSHLQIKLVPVVIDNPPVQLVPPKDRYNNKENDVKGEGKKNLSMEKMRDREKEKLLQCNNYQKHQAANTQRGHQLPPSGPSGIKNQKKVLNKPPNAPQSNLKNQDRNQISQQAAKKQNLIVNNNLKNPSPLKKNNQNNPQNYIPKPSHQNIPSQNNIPNIGNLPPPPPLPQLTTPLNLPLPPPPLPTVLLPPPPPLANPVQLNNKLLPPPPGLPLLPPPPPTPSYLPTSAPNNKNNEHKQIIHKNQNISPTKQKQYNIKLKTQQINQSQRQRIRNLKITVQNSDKTKQDGTIPIKLVLVGDGSVGKTSMLISYTTDNFPTQYVPTIFDNYVADVKLGKNMVKLWLWDTAGQEQYAQLRLISYQKADVFLICFSMIDQISFKNALNKWFTQVNQQSPKAVKIMVGTKSDLHSEYLQDKNNVHKAIPLDYIHKQCQMKKCIFMPCSGLNQKGLNQVFTKAMDIVVDRVQRKKKQESSLCQMI